MSVKASQLTCVPHVSDVQTRSSELSPPDSCLVVLCSGDIVRVTSVDTADGASPNTGKLSNLVRTYLTFTVRGSSKVDPRTVGVKIFPMAADL